MAAGTVIDCDVHPTVPGIKALLPYMDDHWREAIVRRGIDDQTTIMAGTAFCSRPTIRTGLRRSGAGAAARHDGGATARHIPG
jgi:hypothetical protein